MGVKFKLGLVINPLAGIGGRVGLKGSDGEHIKQQAISLGGVKLAEQKAQICFDYLSEFAEKFSVFTASGEMGANVCRDCNLEYDVVYEYLDQSSAKDTISAVKAIQKYSPDILMFVGGDGTARDVCEVIDEHQVALGIPAGVKIHSAVYAVSPQAAGQLVEKLVNNEMLRLASADVVDLDEVAFRLGQVNVRHFGEMLIPDSMEFVQAVKQSNPENEVLIMDDIAAEITESLDDEVFYVIGSGTTCEAIMHQLGLKNTLLGSDIVLNGQIYREDAVEKDFLKLIGCNKKLVFIITAIGGQGHIFGRGNHQLSPTVIRKVGWDNFLIIATQSKLRGLKNGRLLVDTGDKSLDQAISGTKKVITGYREAVLYPVG